MPSLYVKLKIPFGEAPLTFSHWLPIGSKHALHIAEGNIAGKLTFELESAWWASQPTAEDLKRRVNVLAHYVNAELEVTGIARELLAIDVICYAQRHHRRPSFARIHATNFPTLAFGSTLGVTTHGSIAQVTRFL